MDIDLTPFLKAEMCQGGRYVAARIQAAMALLERIREHPTTKLSAHKKPNSAGLDSHEKYGDRVHERLGLEAINKNHGRRSPNVGGWGQQLLDLIAAAGFNSATESMRGEMIDAAQGTMGSILRNILDQEPLEARPKGWARAAWIAQSDKKGSLIDMSAFSVSVLQFVAANAARRFAVDGTYRFPSGKAVIFISDPNAVRLTSKSAPLRALWILARTARGMRTREVTIVTTLLDPVRYSKRKIARIYNLRWEIETNFGHLKTTMNMEHLKCQSSAGVIRELMVFALVYNLIRTLMNQAAKSQGITDANRMSFIDAVRSLCSQLNTPPATLMVSLIENPARPGRHHPRVKKRRMKEYDLMNKPRREYAEPTKDTEVAA